MRCDPRVTNCTNACNDNTFVWHGLSFRGRQTVRPSECVREIGLGEPCCPLLRRRRRKGCVHAPPRCYFIVACATTDSWKSYANPVVFWEIEVVDIVAVGSARARPTLSGVARGIPCVCRDERLVFPAPHAKRQPWCFTGRGGLASLQIC